MLPQVLRPSPGLVLLSLKTLQLRPGQGKLRGPSKELGRHSHLPSCRNRQASLWRGSGE